MISTKSKNAMNIFAHVRRIRNALQLNSFGLACMNIELGWLSLNYFIISTKWKSAILVCALLWRIRNVLQLHSVVVAYIYTELVWLSLNYFTTFSDSKSATIFCRITNALQLHSLSSAYMNMRLVWLSLNRFIECIKSETPGNWHMCDMTCSYVQCDIFFSPIHLFWPIADSSLRWLLTKHANVLKAPIEVPQWVWCPQAFVAGHLPS